MPSRYQILEEETRAWADALIPGHLVYYRWKEDKHKTRFMTTSQKAFWYAQLVAAETVLDATRFGLGYLIYRSFS